ncbi:MAG: class I SAM-dependent methyltransferase [Candidatus Methylomirabilales bacterium]
MRSRFGEIWRAYRNCPIGARLRVLGRYLLCPYSCLLGLFPPAGRILDVGCGDGLLLFLLSLEPESQARTHAGIDPDKDKISVARRARIDNAEFHLGEVSTLPSDAYDCVAIIDVLYLLPKSQWAEFLENSVRVLRKSGLLIVKEIADKPRWKSWFAYIEEILAIRVIGMTKGDVPHFEPIDVYRASIEAAGADVFRIDYLGTGRPHAHVVFLGRKCG